MKNCTMCGIEIPDTQKVCSMCYGDIHYGTDGHYERWAREESQREERDES